MATTSSSKQTTWEKSKVAGKKFFDKVGTPVNKAANKLGAESFWPTSLDRESDKAARILRSFCIDGFAGSEEKKKHPDKHSLDHIPADVIRHCKGLAIFTVLRTGLHWSGAGGSGIIVARLPNGGWSPPSGILIHTLGWGLSAGADIYDCVCVINNDHGMEGFTRVRATIGGEVSAAVGPLGGGSQLDSSLRNPAPVWTYTKSKGLYLGIQVDGTVIVERTSENERFYSVADVRNKQILAGEVRAPSGALVSLWETLQACEGSPHDSSRLPPPGETPGDHDIENPREESHREYDELGHRPEERQDYKA